MQFMAKPKKWGKTLAIQVPKSLVNKINPNATPKFWIFIAPAENPLRETFGTLKLRKNTAQLIKEIDAELDDDSSLLL